MMINLLKKLFKPATDTIYVTQPEPPGDICLCPKCGHYAYLHCPSKYYDLVQRVGCVKSEYIIEKDQHIADDGFWRDTSYKLKACDCLMTERDVLLNLEKRST